MLLEKVYNQKSWSVDPFDEEAKKDIVEQLKKYMILTESESEELYRSIATLNLAAKMKGQAPAKYLNGVYEFRIAYGDRYFLEEEFESDFRDAMIQIFVKFKIS